MSPKTSGTGGGQEDPNANAQSRRTQLGKILRIDGGACM